MKFKALATDYDGTIACDGQVDDETVAALRRGRDAGLQMIMVTGRELTDLFNTFEHVDLFHRIVAENGAVLYDPVTTEIEVLAAAPPRALIDRLTRENIPMSVGHSVVATVEPHERAVLAAIHDLQLDWHVIFNKGSAMVLPSDVTKRSGLRRALDAVGVTPEATIAIGDAENDLVFLRGCGLAVAVANALPVVKDVADLVTVGARGAGTIELIERWLAGELEAIVCAERHRVATARA
jgi:hydroxymethylpyrimidine pyrophosphatase-like HAD family hydrolase